MSTPQSTGSGLTSETILRALGSLSAELGRQGVTGELCLFGGTVMLLAFTARLSTKDVDALFQPASLIRSLARSISEEQQLPVDWLNDGVKGFCLSPARDGRQAIFLSSLIFALPCRCPNICWQ